MHPSEYTVISLFDHSGNWSKPYREAGFNVVQIDLKNGIDVLTWDYRGLKNVFAVLAAVPCTEFTKAGSSHWKRKDLDGRTEKAVLLVRRTLEIKEYYSPLVFSLENPPGRIASLVPELGEPLMAFEAFHFGDAYKKYTCLWGNFNTSLKEKRVPPAAAACRSASSIDTYYGIENLRYSDRAKYRDITPPGFAKAFYEANNLQTVFSSQLKLF